MILSASPSHMDFIILPLWFDPYSSKFHAALISPPHQCSTTVSSLTQSFIQQTNSLANWLTNKLTDCSSEPTNMGNKDKMFGLPFNVWSTERHTKKSNTASNNITINKRFHDRMPLKLIGHFPGHLLPLFQGIFM